MIGTPPNPPPPPSPIMGNPPRMLTAEAVMDAGIGAVFVNVHGEVYRSFQGTDGHRYLAILERAQIGRPYHAPYRMSDLFTPHGPRPVAVGLRLVYKPTG